MASSVLGTEACQNVGMVVKLQNCYHYKFFVNRAKNKQKIIPSDHKELIRGIVRFKDGLETSVENYDHLPLPPVYSQVPNKRLPYSTELFFFPRLFMSPPTPTLYSLLLVIKNLVQSQICFSLSSWC